MLIIAMRSAMWWSRAAGAAMPPALEPIDPRKLHISGEFVEEKLGTTLAHAKGMVSLIDQHRSIVEPQASWCRRQP